MMAAILNVVVFIETKVLEVGQERNKPLGKILYSYFYDFLWNKCHFKVLLKQMYRKW